jgi:hypothetical protein
MFERCQINPAAGCIACSAQDVCTGCDTPTYTLVGAACVLPSALSCRAPEVLRPSTSICENCSTKYVELESTDAGMCSTAKAFTITEATESNFNQKERLYKFASDHFDQFDPLTQEILDNNFEFALNVGTLNSVEFNSVDTAKITFDSFEDGMEVTISVKNATIRETFISSTQSDAIKLLIDNSFTF